MDVKKVRAGETEIAIVHKASQIITGEQDALDFILSVSYETGCERIALNKEAITEDFFTLSNGLAGGILQKFINYHIKFAIIGVFSAYTSKPLKDFMYECNNGNDIFFVSSEQEAIDKLSRAI